MLKLSMLSKDSHILLRLFIASAGCISCLACHSGGVTAGPVPESSVAGTLPSVLVPTIAVPITNPYYSQGNSVDILGMCMTGYTVTLSGSTSDQQVCQNASFNFTIPKSSEGVYSFFIVQTSPGGINSSPVTLTWVKKTSIAKPIILSPSASPFMSAQAILAITGSCETGALVSLNGDGVGSTLCANSAFNLNLPKAQDGDYTLGVTQTDPAGNTASTAMIWKKHELIVSPTNPILEVMKSQVITVSGGAGSYSLALSTNNSGGNLDLATKTYTTGSLANKTDQIVVTDALGVTLTVNISTVSGPADHLSLGTPNSGNLQSAGPGITLANPIVTRVVDRYGNGVAHYPLYYQMIYGDGKIISPPMQLSDFNGNTQINMSMGYQTLQNIIQVSPLSGTLSDVAASGNSKLTFTQNMTANGKGNIGAFYAVGHSPNGLVIADLNGDGEPDVAVLNSGDPSIGILLGIGKGTFGSMTKIRPLCLQPNALGSGDFNSDGKLDLIVSCGGSSTTALQVFLGNGDVNGTFQAARNIAIDPLENIPSALAVADFNGDGKLDIALTLAGSAKVSVRFGLGDGTFAAPVFYNVGPSPAGIKVADLDKDGHLDLLVANSDDNTLGVLINSGTGAFRNQITYDTGTLPVALTTADFDGDGYLDVAVVNNASGDVTVLLNDKTGNLSAGINIVVGQNPNSIMAKDFNSDGIMDILVSNNLDSNLNLLAGQGNGGFISLSTTPVTTNPVLLSSFDVNKDGVTDILVLGSTNLQLQVLPGQSGGVLGYESALDGVPKMVIAKDFDKDGKLDLAVMMPAISNIKILKGLGNGLFAKDLAPFAGSLSTGDGSSNIIAADLRMTGNMDLVVTNPNRAQVAVFANTGDGTFLDPVVFATGSMPVSVIAQDFNKDGNLDLVVVNSGSNSISFLMADINASGEWTLKPGVNYLVGGTPSDVVAVDLNGDKLLDLVVANRTSNTISVLLGNGDGTFQNHVDYSVGVGPANLIAADFDHDGKNDIAVTNTTEGSINILLGIGDGSFKTATTFSAGLNSTGLVSSDFNGDGNLDLGVVNGQEKTFTVLLGNSRGLFNSTASYSTNDNTVGLCVGDFNGDGMLDLGALEGTKKSVQVWIGH